MADAKINLTLTPAEFDLLREQLNQRGMHLLAFSTDTKQLDHKAKHEARQTAAMIGDFLKRLK